MRLITMPSLALSTKPSDECKFEARLTQKVFMDRFHFCYNGSHAATSLRSSTIGSVNENVDPFPSTDSTQILPPCISIMRFAIANPKPVPPFLRVLELS